MYEDYSYTQLLEEYELSLLLILVLSSLFCILFLRNLYNLIKKRSFRKKYKQIKIDNILTENRFQKQLLEIEYLKNDFKSEKENNIIVNSQFVKNEARLKNVIAATERQLHEQQELNNYQRKALEKFADYKSIDANNTRLGAHFIKNVICHVYQNLEKTENTSLSILGFARATQGYQNVGLSIDALKNMFTLLDYNVASVQKNTVTIDEELKHLLKFVDLIKYLKPKTTVTLNNLLDNKTVTKVKIKPTLFFPFLENALKHGSLNKEQSYITINITSDMDKHLIYEVKNSCEQLPKNVVTRKNQTPFGLNALNKLLETYYPDSTLSHRLKDTDTYIAHLKLTA